MSAKPWLSDKEKLAQTLAGSDKYGIDDFPLPFLTSEGTDLLLSARVLSARWQVERKHAKETQEEVANEE